MVSSLAVLVVALAGAFLVALGLLGLAAPARARRFLGGFAATARRHWIELWVRAAIGSALVVASPSLAMPKVFAAAGWILLGTTALMAVVPWRVHLDFAKRAVPRALRYLPAISVGALGAGGTVLWLACARFFSG